MKQRFRGTWPYACECEESGCRRRVRLTHTEYLARAEHGAVRADDCPEERAARGRRAAGLGAALRAAA
jgi:hypothetical protein